MTTSSAAALWDKVCIITDLQLHKVTIKAMGSTKVLMVLQERARWVNLATYSIKNKKDLLNTPTTPQGLFSLAVTLMQRRWEAKKDNKAQVPAPKICSGSGILAPNLQNPQIAEGAGHSTGTTKTLL